MTTRSRPSSYTCQICGKTFPAGDVMPAALLHGALHDRICAKYPAWSEQSAICFEDLNTFRREYIEDNLAAERGELTILQQDVLQSIQANETISKDLNAEFDSTLSFGARLADKVASFGGSWKFIIIFGAILLVWIAGNSVMIVKQPFDRYPFILLNLVLSCVAAIQAPVIMMSQNRQEEKDRLRAEQDFRTNLKAELEIRTLHAKIDELITHQWQRLLEIQQIQVDMMQEMTNHHQWEQQEHATRATVAQTPTSVGK